MVAGVPTRSKSPAADGSSVRLSPDCCQMTEPSEGKAPQGIGRCQEQTIGRGLAGRESALKLLD